MSAEKYCAYNLTRRRFVATDVEAADGATHSSEARLLEMGPGGETALWIFPYRNLSASSARFPIDLVLLDSESTVLDTVEFFPMNVAGEAGARAKSILVLAADSVAQGGIKAGDQLAISAPEEMMRYLQCAQNDDVHPPEPARVIPWPKDTGKSEEQPAETKKRSTRDQDTAEPAKPLEVAPAEPRQIEEPVTAADGSDEDVGQNLAQVIAQEEKTPDTLIAAVGARTGKIAEIAVDSPHIEETEPDPAARVAKTGGNPVASAPAEMPKEEEPAVVTASSSWLAPIPVQPELPWAETQPEATRAVAHEEHSMTAEHSVAKLTFGQKQSAPIREEELAKPEASRSAAPREIEPTAERPVVPSIPEVVQRVRVVAPSAPPEDDKSKIAAVHNVPRPAVEESHVAQFELRPINAPPIPIEPHLANDEVVPAGRQRQWKETAQKNWFMRLLGVEGRDPRSAPRESLPGLVAYFFTGGAPTPHTVRDISMTGLYLVTYERWYKGTVVQMTLTDRGRSTQERSLTVYAQAVRLGGDGVGFQFVLEDNRGPKRKQMELVAPTNGIDKVQVGRFMHKFKTTQAQWR